MDSIKAQRRPRFSLSGLRSSKRRPIVPAWMRSVRLFLGTIAWAVQFAAYVVGWHGFRLPKYAGKLLWHAPRDSVRLVGGYVRWLFDLEGEPFRQDTAWTLDGDQYLKLARQRDRRVRWRGIVTVAVLVALVVAAVLLTVADLAARWIVGGVLLALCGTGG